MDARSQSLDPATREALDTIETLTYFLDDVKKAQWPRSRTVRKITIRKPSWNPYCKFCGHPTEMEMFAKLGVWPERFTASRSKPLSSRRHRLSSSLCHQHRSKSDAGRSAVAYRRVLRLEPEFQRELRALEIASTRMELQNPTPGEALVYPFRRGVIDSRDLYLNNERGLADEARALVYCGITDRKKHIVMLACSGKTN